MPGKKDAVQINHLEVKLFNQLFSENLELLKKYGQPISPFNVTGIIAPIEMKSGRKRIKTKYLAFTLDNDQVIIDIDQSVNNEDVRLFLSSYSNPGFVREGRSAIGDGMGGASPTNLDIKTYLNAMNSAREWLEANKEPNPIPPTMQERIAATINWINQFGK